MAKRITVTVEEQAQQQTEPQAEAGQMGQAAAETAQTASGVGQGAPSPAQQPVEYMRLPNPPIPTDEYLMVSQYVLTTPNMTRQDWMELAVVEKLHRDGLMSDDRFRRRHAEITSRPKRGLRKGTKTVKQ